MAEENVILVTGGSGLVGKGIEWVIENDKSEKFGKKAGEKWIFLNSKDGDLKSKEATKAIFEKYKPTHIIHLAALVDLESYYANLRNQVSSEFIEEVEDGIEDMYLSPEVPNISKNIIEEEEFEEFDIIEVQQNNINIEDDDEFDDVIEFEDTRN
ncbi:7543_t:CDS:2, partial [Entrophospora sp. SA101]